MQEKRMSRKSEKLGNHKKEVNPKKQEIGKIRKKLTQPLGTKKNHATFRDEKNHATSWDQNNHAISQDKKITQPLRT